MVGWFKMPLVKEVGTHATLCYRWGPSGDPAPTAAPSHFTAHLYSGQTVAHRSNCWALVLSIAISVSAFIFSERELTFTMAIYMLSPVRLSPVVCRLLRLCTLLRRWKFSAIFLRHLVPWPPTDIHGKFYGDRLRGTPVCVVGVKHKKDSQIYRFWAHRRLYLGNGAR